MLGASKRIVRGRRLAGESPLWSLVRRRGWFERFSPWAGWVALLLALLLWLDLGQPRDDHSQPQKADTEVLAHAKDLGRGMTALLLEQYHARSWTRQNIRVDSTISPTDLQDHIDALGLRLNAQILVRTPEFIKGIPYGTVVLPPVSQQLRQRWEPEVAELYEASTLLHWLAWGYTATLQEFGSLQREMQQAYVDSYPKVARELNGHLANLGMSARLDQGRSVNPVTITERCWEIDQAMETHFHLSD